MEGLEIRPLLPRKATGATLFSLLADNETGVGYVKNALSKKLLLRFIVFFVTWVVFASKT